MLVNPSSKVYFSAGGSTNGVAVSNCCANNIAMTVVKDNITFIYQINFIGDCDSHSEDPPTLTCTVNSDGNFVTQFDQFGTFIWSKVT